MQEIMRQHLSEVSLFGFFEYSADAYTLYLILGVNLVLTLVHSVQELKGRMWRYLGAIVGVRIPDVAGFLLFFVALTVILWALGFAGIAGYLPFYGQGRVAVWFAMAAVGALIGGRLSDRLYLHIRLDRQGYSGNPGLASTPYYLAEAVILTVLFLPGLWSHYVAASLGFVAGWVSFFSVL
ncbi:MAG: hypothetical protein HYR94_15155, partial [Chloroflexi bacterium]|nr:hypothetical protein [Chloroflexota bacterium]